MVLRINDYSVIPDQMMNQMILYIEESKIPCGFLTALFANDFMKVCGKADEENLHYLPIYAHFIHWEAPMGCNGSYDKVDHWILNKKGVSRGLKEKYWRGE